MRMELGSQRKVAELLGIHLDTIGNYERGVTEAPPWYELALIELMRRAKLL